MFTKVRGVRVCVCVCVCVCIDRDVREHACIQAVLTVFSVWAYKSRIPDQNGVSQALYIVDIHCSGWKPSKLICAAPQSIETELSPAMVDLRTEHLA